jgi:hypothetical protein
MVGSELNPTHCGMLLMGLGALRVNGQVPGPGTSGDPSALVAVTEATSPEQRRAVAQLEVGAPSDDRCIHGFQQLLFAMYVAWTLGTPMLMDA